MKVIKFIGILAAASFLFSFNAMAQEDGNRDADGKVVRGPYVTNGAFDNTFIGLGAGVNSVIEKQFGIDTSDPQVRLDLLLAFSIHGACGNF